MSDRSIWKTLHLLYLYGKQQGLPRTLLEEAGIVCDPDTVDPLLDSGAVEERIPGRLFLSRPAREILRTCIVANRRWSGRDMRVDYPQAFVIMPFSEQWSDQVYDQMIKPAVEEAKLECVRGDTMIRVGDLTQNIWSKVMECGLVVADVSSLNANVFYELGLTHALGKDAFIIKNKDSKVPADIGGAHYYEYELGKLDIGKGLLLNALIDWRKENNAMEVEAIPVKAKQ